MRLKCDMNKRQDEIKAREKDQKFEKPIVKGQGGRGEEKKKKIKRGAGEPESGTATNRRRRSGANEVTSPEENEWRSRAN